MTEQDKKIETIRQKYAGPEMSHAKKIGKFAEVFLFTNMFLYFLGNLCWIGWGSHKLNNDNTQNKNYTPYQQALHDAYIPTDMNGKFSPTLAWTINVMAVLMVSAIVIYSFKIRKADRATVDMMLDIEKLGKEYNFNTAQVEKLVRVSGDIVSKMSKDKRVYFDMLMNGDIKIAKDKTFMNMAVAVMTGHLETHPEDVALIEQTLNQQDVSKSMKQPMDYANAVLQMRDYHVR